MRERREATSLSVAIAIQIEPPKSILSGPSSRSISTASAWLAPLCRRAALATASAASRVMGSKAGLGAAVRHQLLDPLQQRVDMRFAEPVGVEPLQPDRGLGAAAGEQPRDDLFLEHAAQLARHAGGEEEARLANVHRKA